MFGFNGLKFLLMSFCLIDRILNVKAANLSNTYVKEPLSWFKQMQYFRHFIGECEKSKSSSDSGQIIWLNCLKLAGLQLGKRIRSEVIIPLMPGMRFIKRPIPDIEGHIDKKIDGKIYLLGDNLNSISWFDGILWNMKSILNSHVLELNVSSITHYIKETMEHENRQNTSQKRSKANASLIENLGRHRRHRYNMLVTMFFGITALGAIVVPLGFQLLSLVSGKALLLAKMALLLASINALKWVTNRATHYGLYHLPGDHYANTYDREDIRRPRSIVSMH